MDRLGPPSTDSGSRQRSELGRPPGEPRGHARVTWAVETRKKIIALTFDDGPGPEYTPLVLDALDQAGVPATFFIVGERLEANFRIVAGRLDRHEVGNHTWSHSDLSTLGLNGARREIEKAHKSITRIVGREPRLLRPPWGKLGTLGLRAADSFGYEVVLWSHSITERKFRDDPDSVVPYVVDNMAPGTIFLAHDVVADVQLTFLPRIGDVIAELRGHGYEFATVSELLDQREPGIGLTPLR